MEEAIFKTALAAVTSGEYCESDIKVIKEQYIFVVFFI